MRSWGVFVCGVHDVLGASSSPWADQESDCSGGSASLKRADIFHADGATLVEPSPFILSKRSVSLELGTASSFRCKVSLAGSCRILSSAFGFCCYTLAVHSFFMICDWLSGRLKPRYAGGLYVTGLFNQPLCCRLFFFFVCVCVVCFVDLFCSQAQCVIQGFRRVQSPKMPSPALLWDFQISMLHCECVL